MGAIRRGEIGGNRIGVSASRTHLINHSFGFVGVIMCSQRRCGFTTPVRNGICCRKAIRTIKLCIDARVASSFHHTLPTSFGTRVRWMKMPMLIDRLSYPYIRNFIVWRWLRGQVEGRFANMALS